MNTFGDEVRTARKAHRCAYCDAPILAGTKYLRWAWSDGGRADECKAHPECDSLFHAHFDDDEIPNDWGVFRETCEEAEPATAGAFPWPADWRDASRGTA